MPTPMGVRGIGDKTHNASESALVSFYIPTTNGCTAHFQLEIHVADRLDAIALIDIDVLHPEDWVLDLSNEMAELTHNIELKVKLEIVARGEKVKLHIVTMAKTVPPHSRRSVPLGTKSKALYLLKRHVLFESSKKAHHHDH